MKLMLLMALAVLVVGAIMIALIGIVGMLFGILVRMIVTLLLWGLGALAIVIIWRKLKKL